MPRKNYPQPDNREYAKHRQRKFKEKKYGSGYEQMTIFVNMRQREQIKNICAKKGVLFKNQSDTVAFMFNLSGQYVELEKAAANIRAVTEQAEEANKSGDVKAVGEYLREISTVLKRHGIGVGETKKYAQNKQKKSSAITAIKGFITKALNVFARKK